VSTPPLGPGREFGQSREGIEAPDCSAIVQSGLSPMTVLLAMVVIFVILGMFMDSLSMILLFMPIFWPIVLELDFGMDVEDLKIW
jgi:C4-dicarboxylate transporter, DctM subunit